MRIRSDFGQGPANRTEPDFDAVQLRPAVGDGNRTGDKIQLPRRHLISSGKSVLRQRLSWATL